MDAHAVLGLDPGASEREVAAAYRRLAKRWHPDRRRGPDAARRMAEINAAYAELRAGGTGPPVPRPADADERGSRPRPRPRPPQGWWLAEATRRVLGRELLDALQQHEAVNLVTPVATWASPHAVLAVTDRRLVWLLDDAIVDRVRSLRFANVDAIDHRLSWPLRRHAVVRVRRTNGTRVSFAELRPDTARTIVDEVTAGMRRGAPRRRAERR